MKNNERDNLIFILVIVCLVVFFLSIVVVLANRDMTTNKISLIKITGDISLYSSSGFFSSGGTSAESTVKRIERAEEDNSVKAIILEINSGGGTVVASKEIATAVNNAKKPVVAWIREVGASGAYWIASASDKIVADPASITGSVGVRSSYLEFSELFEKYGITYQEISSGKYKEVGSPYKNLSEEEYTLLKSKVEIIDRLFIDEVKRNRDVNDEALDRLSTAEIFLGIEAKDLGLIDILGSKEEALSTAEELANISSSKIVTYVEERSLIEQVVGMLVQPSYMIGRGIGDSLISIENKEILLAK